MAEDKWICKADKLKGTQTEKNLQEAFAGESQARNKYTYFASKAKKDSFEQISKIFLETAENEKEHAKIWYKILTGIGSTIDCLKEATEGESHEWQEMYPSFAKTASAFDSAETVAISLLARKLPRFVLYAIIPKLISRLKQRTIN